MTALTLRLTEEKYQRLKRLAKNKGMTINKLLDEMTTLMLTEVDLETRYLARVERGKNKTERGLELLEKAKQ
jgi:predicted DNA-binding protein